MRWLGFLVLAACAHSATPPQICPQPPATTPVVTPEVPPPRTPKPIEDAEAIALAEAFLGSIDRNDAPGFESATAPWFVQTLPARTYDRKMMTTSIAGRFASKVPVRTRTCKQARVFRGPTSAIYAAQCEVRYPAHDDVPGYDSDTDDTVALALDGDTWKVVLWRWQRLGLEVDREMWNETFRQSLNFKKTANQHLIDAVKGRKPGTALDIEMGQGRNVIYLATQGWKVTGVDISDEGIKMAQTAAAKQKVKFEAIKEDIAKYDFGKNRWDLVTLIYAGSNAETIERVKPSIKKGGLFVVEFFHKEATAGSGIGGFETGALARQFGDGWTILTDTVVDDIADWSLRKTKLVRFTAQKK